MYGSEPGNSSRRGGEGFNMDAAVGVRAEEASSVNAKVGNWASARAAAVAVTSPFQFCSEEPTKVSGDIVLGAVFER